MTTIAIRSVIQMDLPHARIRPSGRGYNVDCPFCGGRDKLNFNEQKNVWRCAKCDKGGSPIKFHALYKGISQHAASMELKEMLLHEKVKAYKEPEQTGPTPPHFIIRDEIYSKLLNNLTLNEIDRQNLLSRGLTDEEIKLLGYKSYFDVKDTEKMASVARSIMDSVDPIGEKHGIPGMTGIGTDEVTFVPKSSGFLIPVRTWCSRISGFQIRYNNVTGDKPRYTWLSSGSAENGCSVTGCENIHHAGDWHDPFYLPETIGLTEGALKADIATVLSDKLYPEKAPHKYMGLTGVNNLGQLKHELEICSKRGVKEIVVCVDMDYRDKKEVAKALRKIKGIIESCDTIDHRKMKCTMYQWDPTYKGIDDYLLSVYKRSAE